MVVDLFNPLTFQNQCLASLEEKAERERKSVGQCWKATSFEGTGTLQLSYSLQLFGVIYYH